MPAVRLTSHHYPFGMVMPNRNWQAGSADGHTFGFNGKYRDDEINGENNNLDFDARIYAAKIGKWLTVDAEQQKYASLSPYHFAGCNPTWFVEIDGNVFDLSTLSQQDKEAYEAVISMLNQSELFSYYYNKLSISETVYTIKFDPNQVQTGRYFHEDNLISFSKIHEYVVAQELFHAYQDEFGYDMSTNGSNSEAEGDIMTMYVIFTAGLGLPGFGDWSEELIDEYGQFEIPEPVEVLSDNYNELFQEAVQKRIEYYSEKQKDEEAGFFADYLGEKTNQEPQAIRKVILESDETLVGPRMENGDFYQD